MIALRNLYFVKWDVELETPYFPSQLIISSLEKFRDLIFPNERLKY